MENYYRILGLRPSASQDEVRRAYRVLARRYHPDVNPGEKSGERFKIIAAAYAVLGDTAKRAAYDRELEQATRQYAHAAYRSQQQRRTATTRERYEEVQRAIREPEARRAREAAAASRRAHPGGLERLGKLAAWTLDGLSRVRTGFRQAGGIREKLRQNFGKKISVIEVSLTVQEAITGMRKTVEVAEPEGARKISVTIPAGVRNGSVIHQKSKDAAGEDFILLTRVSAHPFISMQVRGIVVEVPVSVQEALLGASIRVPSLDGPMIIRIPANSQSGHEIRQQQAGVRNEDGSRGDIFYRLLVKVPESSLAVGIAEQASALEAYYERPVRADLPDSLLS